MAQLRIALAQINPTVGDLAGNAALILDSARRAAGEGAHVLAVPGDTLPVVRVRGIDVAVAICEDLWQDGGPVAAAADAGAGLLLSINASPYELNKDDVRYELLARRAAEAGCTLAYVNQVGGQDELVFDGDSIIVSAECAILARAGQ